MGDSKLVTMLSIAISTAKGGTTKTTTTINLACGLAARGYRVLVADLDSQTHATMLLNDGTGRVEVGEGIDAVLQRQARLADVVWQGRGGVFVASSPRSRDGAPVLEQVNLWLGTQLRREQILRAAIEEVEGDFDVLLMDCPPARNAIVENALYAADWILCPIALNSLHYHGIREVLSFAEYVVGRPKPLSVLVSLYRSSCSTMNNKTLEALAADVEANLYSVFATRVPFTTELDKAIDQLRPIFDVKPDSTPARAYMSLVDEIATLIPRRLAA